MNDQLQKQLADILAAIHKAASAGADFAMGQLPDIAQQFVAYGRVSLTLFALIGVAMLAYAVVFLRKAIRTDDDSLALGFGVLSGALVFFGIITFAWNISSTLMVWFAPKVWLLKELAGLLK